MNIGAITKRSSSMVIFSDALDHYSHRVRIVLAEKGVAVEVVEVTESDMPQEVSDLNPYSETPTLLDRDLVLYEPNVMMEYLDGRFPHPVCRCTRSPAHRAACGCTVSSAIGAVTSTLAGTEKEATLAKLRKELRDSLLSLSPIFEQKPFFMSDEFSIVDCAMAPILWRLPLLGIELPPKQAKGLLKYCERLFRRDGFPGEPVRPGARDSPALLSRMRMRLRILLRRSST